MVSGTEKANAAAPDAADSSIAPARAAEAEISGAAGKNRPPPRAGARDARVKEGSVGSALRSVYQQTVSEDVPDDLMQLLGKLS